MDLKKKHMMAVILYIYILDITTNNINVAIDHSMTKQIFFCSIVTQKVFWYIFPYIPISFYYTVTNWIPKPDHKIKPSKTHFCQFVSFLNASVKFRQVSVEHIFQDECVNE